MEVKKACEFLLGHQMEDGGWGEDFAVRSYHTHYAANAHTHTIHTLFHCVSADTAQMGLVETRLAIIPGGGKTLNFSILTGVKLHL